MNVLDWTLSNNWLLFSSKRVCSRVCVCGCHIIGHLELIYFFFMHFKIEALECLSTSLSMIGVSDQGSMSDIEKTEVLNKILMPFPYNSSRNWISGDVAFHMETHAKLDLSMQYISKLLREHPSWPDSKCSEYGIQQYNTLLEIFHKKLMGAFSYLEQKFSLNTCHLINMVCSCLAYAYISDCVIVLMHPDSLFQKRLMCPFFSDPTDSKIPVK